MYFYETWRFTIYTLWFPFLIVNAKNHLKTVFLSKLFTCCCSNRACSYFLRYRIYLRISQPPGVVLTKCFYSACMLASLKNLQSFLFWQNMNCIYILLAICRENACTENWTGRFYTKYLALRLLNSLLKVGKIQLWGQF